MKPEDIVLRFLSHVNSTLTVWVEAGNWIESGLGLPGVF